MGVVDRLQKVAEKAILDVGMGEIPMGENPVTEQLLSSETPMIVGDALTALGALSKISLTLRAVLGETTGFL